MSRERIALAPRLSEARGPQEDWTGLKERKARRKLQNRLNVRAYRRRKACAEQAMQENNTEDESPFCVPNRGASELASFYNIYHAALIRTGHRYRPIDYAWLLGKGAYPISRDHLIPVIQYNLVRACVTNASILSLLDDIPLNCHGNMWGSLPLFPAPAIPPAPLAPTELQKTIPHEAWIDLLPDATLRDNTLRALGHLDILQLSRDLSGSMCRGDHSSQLRGMLVWSDPWTPEGWEMSEGFVKNWGFLLKGCWQMLAATNSWRRKRNEPPLALKL